MRRVLITGAAGRIGSTLRNGFRGRVSALRLLDTALLGDAQQGEELYAADVRDLPALTDAMTDVDATIHLAGIPQEDTFERIRDINMTGTYHVFEAARRQGCTRVVLASSAHVTGFYRTRAPTGSTRILQLDRGLYGPLLVDDPAEPGRYDHEQVVVLDDWTDGIGPTPEQLQAWLSPAIGALG